MKKARFYLTFSITLLITTISNAQSNYKTIPKDFEKLSGSW